ncbi:4Fe-4S dicluster domain-containing protein [Candidatus Aerophobetes bacterium]|nr:4Fe-4S dicluster domain-containing protein [Candidatus Aerophobetes bacterium]
MKELLLSRDNYLEFIQSLSTRFPVYAPMQKGDFLFFEKVNKENVNRIVVDTRRTIHPLKSFFLPPERKVSEYFTPSPQSTEQEERVILGAKNCDLNALKVLDSVYSGERFGKEYKDPFYIQAREKTIIISSDCTSPDEVCFCTLIGSKPFPEEGFDLNLSPVKEGFIVQVGSEKGEKVIKDYENLFSSVNQDIIKKREKNRKKTFNLVERINKEFKTAVSYRELIKDSYESSVWERHSEKCVDCGGCNYICPTCRCFLLSDKKVEGKYQRFYLWDACLLTGFARVAGGANPRSQLYQRFANRLFCKFYFFPENVDLDACTGCGRCIAVCIGKIDMRKVLRDLAVEKKIGVGLER